MIDKILLLYICITIACAFWQPNIIFGVDQNNQTDQNVIQTFFNLGLDNNTGYPGLPTCAGNNCYSGDNGLNNLESGGNQTLIQKMFNKLTTATNFFIDPLNNVLQFFTVAFRVVFAPFVIFTSADMVTLPPALFYIIVVPLALLLLIAFVNWIRSGIT